MAHGNRWSTHDERERSQFIGEVAFNVGNRTVRSVAQVRKLINEEVDIWKRRFANPFGPYDRMDFIAGSVALGSTYIIQAGMILWGPPPVKALGIGWVAVPMGDPFVFGLGVKYNPF